jgi:Alpha-kinase family
MGRGASAGQKRTVASEKETGIIDKWTFYTILDHRTYSPRSKCLVNLPTEPPGAFREDTPTRQSISANPPPYLAMNTSSCGYGAECIAFRCSLANRPSTRDFTLGARVAKETNLVHQMSENVAFHKAFCETQSLAFYLADEFNMRIRATSAHNPFKTPIITFLPCSVLVLQDHTVPDGIRGVLVEKMLDTKRFGWCKWNDNGGGVEGQAYHAPLDLECELKVMRQGHTALVGVIEEGDEEEDSEDDSDDDHVEMPNHVHDSRTGPTNDIAPQAYLQAFSHFTHAFTNRKVLVCDLQGVYNTSTVPPTFELTDPAIHYRSKKRRMVYGRTDKGESGIRLFFKTHKYSDICKLVNLSKRNKDWHQAWCHHHQSKHASAV